MTTTTTGAQSLDKARAALTARLAKVQAQIAELTESAESIKDQLRELDPGDWTNAAGVPVLRVGAQRRFSQELALAFIPEDARRECLTVAYDDAKIKARLTPLQLDECMVEYGKRKLSLL